LLIHEIDRTATTRERVRLLRAIELLERIGTAEAKAMLAVIAAEPAGLRTTIDAKESLARLR
jgi:hypothetical protein